MTRPSLVLVSGLSGAGRSSTLRALEDVGYEAIDNPPMTLLGSLIAAQGGRCLAVGLDIRTSGFDPQHVLALRDRAEGSQPVLVFATADETTLLRRYTETRRRHPMAPQGRVVDGIAAEIALTEPLRAAADLVIDTSDLPLAGLRRLVEQRFGRGAQGALTVSLLSFAFPAGLPREADMVFDARFLRNPHYDPVLKPRTGLDPAVGAYVEADPDYSKFFAQMTGLLDMVLPRFVQEGKKYATIAVGCTGGRHRSVHLVEQLGVHFSRQGERGFQVTIAHRELQRGVPDQDNGPLPGRAGQGNGLGATARGA